jgi:pimeloyl-ACP methyl ester carboxylesterase
MKHHILYIPGLGDGYDPFRQNLLRFWSIFSVTAQLVPMQWFGDESYDAKYQRASQAITDLAKTGAKISLVGESAGGSMAINLFAAHPQVANLVTIAGVNQASTPVASHTLRRGPAFAVSRRRISESLLRISDGRRRRIYSLSAWMDSVVTARHSHIPGANSRRIWSVGHLYTITLCLTLLSGYVVYLAKK